MSLAPHAQWRDQTLVLQVYIQARASRDELVGWQEQGLKIRLKAPPVDGAANKYLVKFLARQFDVPASNIRLLKGETTRQKGLRLSPPALFPVLYRRSNLNHATRRSSHFNIHLYTNLISSPGTAQLKLQ